MSRTLKKYCSYSNTESISNFRVKGRALIIGHEDFLSSNLGKRAGNEKDVKNLEKTYKQLGLVVTKVQDLTRKGVLKELNGEYL